VVIPPGFEKLPIAAGYLAPARAGDWVEGEIAIVKRTGRLAAES
jgi:hypothetical protein